MKRYLVAVLFAGTAGCATLTEPANAPVVVTFSDDSAGSCTLRNKRGTWSIAVPGTVSIRKSDDPLVYSCETTDGRTSGGSVESELGAETLLTVFGVVDALTDKHRHYPSTFTVPVRDREAPPSRASPPT